MVAFTLFQAVYCGIVYGITWIPVRSLFAFLLASGRIIMITSYNGSACLTPQITGSKIAIGLPLSLYIVMLDDLDRDARRSETTAEKVSQGLQFCRLQGWCFLFRSCF